MIKNYETPSIEIIKYESDIHTVGGSIVINFPWTDDDESEFFE